MTGAVPILEVRAVQKHYGAGVVALQGVDLGIAPGEWIAIGGPSGSGKTTLLQLLATLDVPTAGRILFKGRDLAGLDDIDGYRRQSIGMVFQLHNLLPHLNVRDNIEVVMMGTGLGRRARVERVDELIGQVGLDAQQTRRPPEMSGGERQRAAIARALANRPDVLLADEPTGSLDPDHVHQLVGLLGELNQAAGMTIVMVTHDPTVAARAGRTVTLAAGRILVPAEDDQPRVISRD